MTSESEKRKTVLIQLIGGQALPNVICTKSISPDVVYSIYTNKTAETLQNIRNFFELRLQGVEHIPQRPESTFPSIAEMREIIENDIRKEREANPDARIFINYTGGTKQMSIGAFLAGKFADATLIYTDDGRKIVQGENSELTDLPHSELSLEEILAANGHAVKDRREISPELLELAKEIRNLREREKNSWDLRQNRFSFYPAAQERAWKLKKNFFGALKNVENYFKEIIEFSKKNGAVYGKALRLCTSAGWTEKIPGFYKISSELTSGENPRECYDKLSFANNFLDGGWWEALVADAFGKILGSENVAWSVTTSADGIEDDILAVDDTRLYVVSCKAGIEKKGFKKEFDKHNSRTKHLGGTMAVPVFAYYGNLEKDFLQYGESVGIRFISPLDIISPEVLKTKLNLKR